MRYPSEVCKTIMAASGLNETPTFVPCVLRDCADRMIEVRTAVGCRHVSEV